MKVFLFLLLFSGVNASGQEISKFGLDPNKDHTISLDRARAMIAHFQGKNISGQQWFMYSGTLRREIILMLMGQHGTEYLRYYYGVDETGALQVMLCAARADGSDVVYKETATRGGWIICLRRNVLFSDYTVDNIITPKQAAEMFRRYKKSPYFQKMGGIWGASLAKQGVLKFLEQPFCAGVRFYNGLDDNGFGIQILVPVTKNSTEIETTEPIILDLGSACPPNCPPPPEFELLEPEEK